MLYLVYEVQVLSECAIILLCAELKHKKEPMKLGTAFTKLKQYRELVKQGVMQ